MKVRAFVEKAAMDEKKYGRLLARVVPRIPQTEEEYQSLVGQIAQLMEQDEENLSVEETRLLALLALVVENYEQRNFPVSDASPHDLLAHLMEARSLRHKDIWQLFGSKGVASEVISRKRPISKAQAKKLAAFFHVSAELFI